MFYCGKLSVSRAKQMSQPDKTVNNLKLFFNLNYFCSVKVFLFNIFKICFCKIVKNVKNI